MTHMSWFKKKPKGSGDPALDMMLARLLALVDQSLMIAGPKEQEAWVRAQVAEDARLVAAARGSPHPYDPIIQEFLDSKIYPSSATAALANRAVEVKATAEEQKSVISCPKCGQNLRVPSGKDLVVTCP